MPHGWPAAEGVLCGHGAGRHLGGVPLHQTAGPQRPQPRALRPCSRRREWNPLTLNTKQNRSADTEQVSVLMAVYSPGLYIGLRYTYMYVRDKNILFITNTKALFSVTKYRLGQDFPSASINLIFIHILQSKWSLMI